MLQKQKGDFTQASGLLGSSLGQEVFSLRNAGHHLAAES
jgi:hypothetical protein